MRASEQEERYENAFKELKRQLSAFLKLETERDSLRQRVAASQRDCCLVLWAAAVALRSSSIARLSATAPVISFSRAMEEVSV